MENLKLYRSIKHYLQVLQERKLEKIIDVVLVELNITKADLMQKTKERPITEARRRIAYLSKITYNIQGKIIAKRLNLQMAQISQLVFSTFGICQVESDYKNEINALINKIE